MWRNALEESKERLAAGDADYFGERLPRPKLGGSFSILRTAWPAVDIETDGTAATRSRPWPSTTDARTVRTYANGRNLEQFTTDILESKVLVTFNGRCFDAPVLTSHLARCCPRPTSTCATS